MRRPSRSAGFTLIEMLVAILIAAVLIGMVVVSGAPSPSRALETDADRLAQLLALAREEAQVRGAPIRLEVDERQFRFVQFRDAQWRVIDNDSFLRPRAWSDTTEFQLIRSDGAGELEFGRDLVDAPYRIRLARPPYRIEIVANGLGAFEIVRP